MSGARVFQTEVGEVLPELRSALAGVLEHLDPPISRATDLRQRLRLDQSLSWNIYNAATASDSLAIAPNLPGPRPMQRFLDAASACGVPQEALDGVRVAFERYEALIARHARSRDAFETMVAEIGGDKDQVSIDRADAKHKRAMFHAAALLMGRQARVFLSFLIVHPSETKGRVDLVGVGGKIGLHQTRHGVPLQTIAGHLRNSESADPEGPAPAEALDPDERAPGSVGLLRAFCSKPLPRFRTTLAQGDNELHELVAEGLGMLSEVTYFTGHAARAVAHAPGGGPQGDIKFARLITTPTEVCISDVLMHESVWDETPPKVGVYAWPVGSSSVYRDSELLPMHEKAVYLGRGVRAGRTPRAPQYTEMVSYAMDRMGWNPDEFRVFRCVVEHPMLYSRIRMVFSY